MPKVENLDAAQRTIESDSFLMQCYMATDARRTITQRITEVFNNQISTDARKLAAYLEIKNQLERNGEQP